MDFTDVTNGILEGLKVWENKLTLLSADTIMNKRNSQNRTIKQILGHLVDSASNNIHRMVHLQYRENPMSFPNYASNGNNDRWIAIQDYQREDWNQLIQLWKFTNLHLVHVINHINRDKLENEWISGSDHGNIKLKKMVHDYLTHFNLHLSEIEDLIESV